MNKRIRKKANKYYKLQLRKLKLKEDDILMIKLNKLSDIRLAGEMYKNLKTIVPNKVIAVPSSLEISAKSKENIIKLLMN